MQEWIGLLDCNNFFVSCERLFRPDLKYKPVVVLSSNDGCVVARSQEIKDSGIPMGVPYFQIKDIIKDIGATTFSSHFALYRDVSRRVFEVMRRELNVVEQYSIDEAFFKISGSSEEVRLRISDLKDRVEREVGIPVSIGVASSKTRAKYASSVAKRTKGICLMTEKMWNEEVTSIPLATVWGVGAQTTRLYKSHGIITVADFLKLQRRQVQALSGVLGERLWQELSGIEVSTLTRRLEHQKSILHSRSFRSTTSDLSVLKDAVAYHVREAAEDLRSMELKAAFLQVSLGTSRHGDFLLHGASASVVFTLPTDDSFVFLKHAMELVDGLYREGVPYKKAGILLTQFSLSSSTQLTMFEEKSEEKTTALMPVIDSLNRALGKGSVLLGSRLQTKGWQSSLESRSPAYTTSWAEIKRIKA